MFELKPKASFFTLGCRLNQAETALISDSFKAKGYEIVDYGEAEDICVINTCTVTEQADAKCRQLVRQTLRRSPEAFVAIVGCYAQMDAKTLSRIEGVDLIVGNEEKLQIADFIDLPHKLPSPIVRNPRISRSPFSISSIGNYENSTRANLKIQDGCDFMCSFCVIPFARGRARSRAFWDIQREAIELVERGHKEIVLTGVNIGTYEFEGKRLLDVLKMLETVAGLERIRISSIEPTTIPEDLIAYMAESDKICKHLHIPIQSGDDSVLRAMRRLYSVAEYMDFLDLVQRRIPDVCLGTDVMVGFPGEGQLQFAETKQLLNEIPFAYFHVFSFSERAGTAAAKVSGKVDPKVKKERSHELRQLSASKREAFYRQHIGRKVDVLIEEQNAQGFFQGMTDNYVKVGIPNGAHRSNEMVRVAIDSVADPHLALGHVIEEG